MSVSRLVLRSLALVALVCCGLQTPAAATWEQYYYFDEARTLQLDTATVAALNLAGRSSELGGFLTESEFAGSETRDLPIPGWSLFDVSEASSTPSLAPDEQIASDIAALIQQDQNEDFFFTPVFVGELGPIIPSNSILVVFEDDVTETEVATALAAVGLGSTQRTALDGAWNAYSLTDVSRSGITVLERANALAQRSEVIAAEPNMVFQGQSASTPNDPFYPASWGLDNTGQTGGTPDIDIDAPEAWERTEGSSQVLTVILDTGVDQYHQDLRQLPGYDVTYDAGNGGPINSCDNHGTPVAGIVTSIIDNGLGTVGVAPKTWTISIRTFQSVVTSACDQGWYTETYWTVNALDLAQVLGARVTNNSNFYGFTSSVIATKYQQTRDAGLIHFASAGNFAQQFVEYPASLSSVYAVTAIEDSGNRASFSSWGPQVAFTGPGEDLYSTDRTGFAGWTSGNYASGLWGTSFSSPMVAGVTALLLSEAFSLDADEVDALLKASALDLGTTGWDQLFGWGLPKASDALEALDLFSDDFESSDTSRWSNAQP